MRLYRILQPISRATLTGLVFATAAAVCAGDFFESDGVAVGGFDPVSCQTEQRADKVDDPSSTSGYAPEQAIAIMAAHQGERQ